MAAPALAGDDDYVQGSATGPEGQISELGMEYGVELYDFDKADTCVADALQIRDKFLTLAWNTVWSFMILTKLMPA